MPTALSHDIRVTVTSRYEAAESDPHAGRHVFSYRVHMTNRGRDTVQLLRRYWRIHDSLGALREVEGPGVAGETPVLQPGSEYVYSSACALRSALGRMEGSYQMVRTGDGRLFKVSIPAFDLQVPWSAN